MSKVYKKGIHVVTDIDDVYGFVTDKNNWCNPAHFELDEDYILKQLWGQDLK